MSPTCSNSCRARTIGCADLVIAADSLPYMPDLAPLSREVARVLDEGGLFAFTVETHDGDGVILRETLRYAHGAGPCAGRRLQAPASTS